MDHAEAVEANNVWKTYFETIRKVCPWSLPAYQKDLIQIVHHLNYAPLGDLHARVYVCDLPPNRLKKISQKEVDLLALWPYTVRTIREEGRT